MRPHTCSSVASVETPAVSPRRCDARRWGGKRRGRPGDSFSEHSPRERPPIRAAVPEGTNTEGKCPRPPVCSYRRWWWWTPSRDKAPEGGLTRRTISPLGAISLRLRMTWAPPATSDHRTTGTIPVSRGALTRSLGCSRRLGRGTSSPGLDLSF